MAIFLKILAVGITEADGLVIGQAEMFAMAGTPTSMNREHCITGASRCVAVNPSDSAPALIALGAQFVIRGPGGEKIVEAQDYFMSPAVDIQRMTVLETRRIVDLYSYSDDMVRGWLLLRKNGRSEGMGFCPYVGCFRYQNEWWYY